MGVFALIQSYRKEQLRKIAAFERDVTPKSFCSTGTIEFTLIGC
jgi:hypothetical protein